MNRTRAFSLRFGLVLAMVAPTVVAGCNSSTSSTSSSSTINGVSSILFIKRVTTTVTNGVVNIDVAGGNGQVIDYSRYEPGGSLNILSPPVPSGHVYNLTSAFPTADFNGADISFDATQAVFSMKTTGDDHYHIYTVQLSTGADGKYEIHQKTAGDYDDINPIYMPGSLIAFVTNEMYTTMGTRADEYEHSRVVVQLATISVDGGDADRHLFPQSLSHTVAPFLRADGKIGYSRWEHLGADQRREALRRQPRRDADGRRRRAARQAVQLALQRPRDLDAERHDRHRHRPRADDPRGRARPDRRAQPRRPGLHDPRTSRPRRRSATPASTRRTRSSQVLTPNVPTRLDPSPVGRYREPSRPPRRPHPHLVGRRPGQRPQRAGGDAAGLRDLRLRPGDPDQPARLQRQDRLGPQRDGRRRRARAAGRSARSRAGAADSVAVRLGSINIDEHEPERDGERRAVQQHAARPGALQGAVAVRIIEGFSSEAAKGVSMFGLTMYEGAAVLGEAPVYPDGSWLANVPPYIPVHLQPIDKFGIAIRNQRLWIQGMPGEDRRCVGCHESRTGQGVPALGQNPTAPSSTAPRTTCSPSRDRAIQQRVRAGT